MKRVTTAFALSLLTMAVWAQNGPVKARHDERIELMSILCHLAGFDEYNMNQGGRYIADIDSFFSDVREHPAVQMMDSLRRKKGVGYDSPMALAIHLKKTGDDFVLVNDSVVPERRWRGVDMARATAKISDFYKDSRFAQFFEQHRPFYEEVCSLYNATVLPRFNQGWYESFYGVPPTDRFEVVIGFTNGGACYGPSRSLPGQPRDVYAIVGLAYDDDGIPYFASKPETYLETLVHEFNHSFVNPLAADPRYAAQMKDGASELLGYCRRVMRRNAYSSWQTLVNESIVRAAVILYLMDNHTPEDKVRESIVDEMSTGFYWMPELVGQLQRYSRDRKTYPSIDMFYPVLIDFFKDRARDRSKAIDAVTGADLL